MYKAARGYSLKRLQGVRPYRQELVKPPLGPKNPESTPTYFLCFREGISYRHRVVKPPLSPKATLGYTGEETFPPGVVRPPLSPMANPEGEGPPGTAFHSQLLLGPFTAARIIIKKWQ